MVERLTVVVPGPPGWKGRARFSRQGFAYTDAKTRNYEALLRDYAQEAMDGGPLMEGPVRVEVEALFPIPESWSKAKKRRAAEGGEFPGRPDVDNILKVIDALNGIVWKDDRQVVSAWAGKFFTAGAPHLRVKVWRLQSDHLLRSKEPAP